ncbi:MAG: tRNA 2-thiouridine(34) synthase MnmA [Candidatus Omnitrophica bacterium]|nr:tRNA 2-thiouridine(34) synthase MnmA [Candidatus Omnitrophota bacterium]
MAEKKRQRVVIAMSGGVDSSVAAALLLRQGFEVIGMTMCFGLREPAGKRPSCCGMQGIEDARRVAAGLGIRHYTLAMQKPLEEYVIRDFVRQYLAGRTPNPCVRCNQFVKFNALLAKAHSLGACYLATGHYARIAGSKGRLSLKKAKDRRKDQSYFLYRLNQGQLASALFPLGEYTKAQVRSIAEKLDLPVAHKPGSQEICFLPDQKNYRLFLSSRAGARIKPGQVIDGRGKPLGTHRGIAFYTIGQRQGLGIAAGAPLYITALDPRSNTITVGSRREALKKKFRIEDPHFIFALPKKRIVAGVRIRYNHSEALADIYPDAEGSVLVEFKRRQFAITPGQSAVFYDKDTVLGGGVIGEVLC